MIHLPTLWLFVILLAVHWMGDFVLQTHWQATNKSKNMVALTLHVVTYTGVLLAASILLFGNDGALFALANGVLHWGTDYFTSRWTSRLWAKQDIHNFFVVIGLDQLIHYATLAGTLTLFSWPR